ncbi:MAG: alpha/beta hydrolase [Burkholderiales bacterium]
MPSRVKLVRESYRIPSADAGIDLYVRNKRPQNKQHFRAEKILLYLHGATYPAETAFDFPIGGGSWMDYIARRGFDVYLMDVRGYGGSTRPPQMYAAAETSPPIADTATAIRDLNAVIEHICARRKVEKINLMGWSWGTSIMGAYTARNNHTVNKLVLYAPLWLGNSAFVSSAHGVQGAYRVVALDSIRERWLQGVPRDKTSDLIPAGVLEKWIKTTLATDPIGSKRNPPALVVPNGAIKDLRDYWAKGVAYYDPGKITVPALVAHAEWDHDLPSPVAQTFFSRLTQTRYKRYIEIGEGTHALLLEKNRMQLYHEVQLFLEQTAPE